MTVERKEYQLRLARNVIRLRKAKDLSQLQLSVDAGLALSRIGEIEQGKGNQTMGTLSSVARALDVDIQELFEVK